MDKNLPNKLTIARIILIIPFVVLLLCANAGCDWGFLTTYSDYICLAIFLIASFTDMLDGKIARKYNFISNFGKFMDPIADKLLVCSAMICLIELGRIPSWIVLIIIAREFIISGFRLVASDQGRVLAASYWGKSKTVSQMVMVSLMLLNIPALSIVTTVIMYIALALTIISLMDYLIKNWDVMKEN